MDIRILPWMCSLHPIRYVPKTSSLTRSREIEDLKILLSDYMKRNNTGYLQDDFRIRCRTRHCKISTITKETLALGKLSWDIIADGSTPASHLACVLRFLHSASMNLISCDVGEHTLLRALKISRTGKELKEISTDIRKLLSETSDIGQCMCCYWRDMQIHQIWRH